MMLFAWIIPTIWFIGLLIMMFINENKAFLTWMVTAPFVIIICALLYALS